MRLLSNLYKQRYVASEPSGKRIINSNQMVEQKLAQLQRSCFMKNMDVQENGGFLAGILAQEVEAVQTAEPETDYIKEAKEEAERILAEARTQVEHILSDANEEAASIREQAREEGRQQGYAEGSEIAEQELKQEQKNYEDKINKQEEQYQDKLEDMEPKLLDVILQVIEKVFHIQFSNKKEILLYLIQKTLGQAENCRQFQIRTGQDNYQFLETHKDEIANALDSEIVINIIADPAMKDDACLIETESGMYDCSISTEFENLIKDIRSLCS